MEELKTKFKKLKHYNSQGHVHELTFSCYHRYKYLNDPIACEMFIEELFQSKEEHQFQLWAYVLMPNHVHLLIWPLNAKYNIASILNSMKGRMAKKYRDQENFLRECLENRIYSEFSIFGEKLLIIGRQVLDLLRTFSKKVNNVKYILKS